MYEFIFGPVDVALEQRRGWLKEKVEEDMTAPTRMYREKMLELYGKEKGEKIHYIEAFEICEYGGRVTPEVKKRLFPFAK
jgi:hypothetical protein